MAAFFEALGGRGSGTVPHFISRESKREDGKGGDRVRTHSARETARHRQIMRANICRAPGISALLHMQNFVLEDTDRTESISMLGSLHPTHTRVV